MGHLIRSLCHLPIHVQISLAPYDHLPFLYIWVQIYNYVYKASIGSVESKFDVQTPDNHQLAPSDFIVNSEPR